MVNWELEEMRTVINIFHSVVNSAKKNLPSLRFYSIILFDGRLPNGRKRQHLVYSRKLVS